MIIMKFITIRYHHFKYAEISDMLQSYKSLANPSFKLSALLGSTRHLPYVIF